MKINILTAVPERSLWDWKRIQRGEVSIGDGGALKGDFGLDMDSVFLNMGIFSIIV